MRLKDKSAIITGGGRGLGEAMAMRFAEEGANVLVADVDYDVAVKVAERIKGLKRKGLAFKADVRDKAQVKEMVDFALSNFGKVDILVNNAGTIKDNLIENISEEDWDLVLDINLKGAFLCTQAVVPGMKKNKYGKIINVAARAYHGNIGQANYSSSKGGLVSMTRSMGLELGRYNINTNCVAPGLIDTELSRTMKNDIREMAIAATPIRRIGQPIDIANAALFFASDESSFCLGQTLDVCGGRSVGTLYLKPKSN